MSKRYGLVVCGGQSSRMGTDKSMLDYHGKPQRYHLCDLLKPLCDEVYISCNKDQALSIAKEYNVIVDINEYKEIGPMAALLSAFKYLPNSELLVVGCDYPFIDTSDLLLLIDTAKNQQYGASYYDESNFFYEPLLSDYHYPVFNHLMSNFSNKKYSIQQVLKQIDMPKVHPTNPNIIKSIDTKEDYIEVKRILSSS